MVLEIGIILTLIIGDYERDEGASGVLEIFSFFT